MLRLWMDMNFGEDSIKLTISPKRLKRGLKPMPSGSLASTGLGPSSGASAVPAQMALDNTDPSASPHPVNSPGRVVVDASCACRDKPEMTA